MIPQSDDAEVALLLEGTYPYVSGGVSSWIHQIIQAHPELRFALIFIGSRRVDYEDFRYKFPANVVHFEEHFLYDQTEHPFPKARTANPHAIQKIMDLVNSLTLYAKNQTSAESVIQAIQQISIEISPVGNLPIEDFLYGKEIWEIIRESYLSHCTDPSFLDYFWTLRMMFLPLWKIARIAHEMLPVKVVHSASTGYAGLLGAMLQDTRQIPFILSEHGIYTKERQIDLLKSDWIKDNRNFFQKNHNEVSYFRQMWIDFFGWIGRYCYSRANPIIALYGNNRLRQIADGADPAKTQCIPNGIHISDFSSIRRSEDAPPPPVICFLGRIVPIKDVKTLIRAMRRIVNFYPDAKGWIVGPEEEDPAYVKECKNLVNSLGLDDNIQFLGFQRTTEILPQVGVVVLSSISEALPLVILEANAAGIPVVATDVGSCRQLLEGLDEDDQALGPSGRVVGIADPRALADSILELLTDTTAWQKASRSGIARVEKYYSDQRMFDSYRNIYANALAMTKELH